MPGISLERHKLRSRKHNQTETGEEEDRSGEARAGWHVTFALSDRSSTCVNWPCSEGSDTTTPTNPDISARHGPAPPAPAAAAAGEKNPDQKTEPAKITRGRDRADGAALGVRRGEIPFELVHGKAPSGSARFPCARRKRRAMASRFRGGRGAEVGKWWNEEGQGWPGRFRLFVYNNFYSIFFQCSFITLL